MSSLLLRRLVLLLSSFSLAFIALASIYSLTLARPQASMIVVNPGQSIQAAIDAATPGDTVVVNAGTYTESLTLSKAVSVTGVSSATVIINALPNERVLTVTGSLIDSSVVISGMTLTGGRMYYGAGIYIINNAQPLIRNTSLRNNFAASLADDASGGGIFSQDSLVLIDVEFINNSAYGNGGGGLYIAGAGTTTILTRCRFINNLGFSRGGAIYSAGSLKLFNTDILTNMAGNVAGSFGGGVYASSAVEVFGGRFENNVGGGLRAESVIVSGTNFISNSAHLGGAILSGDVLVSDSYFERNTADGEGGAIRSYRSLMLSYTTFISNTGVDYGGAVSVEQIEGTAAVIGGQFINNRVSSGGLYGLGGGMYSFYDVYVTGTHFINNSAPHGGGLYALMAATIENSRFERNASTGTRFFGGGGMRSAGPLNMTNTQFVNNSAVFDGGGLYFSGGAGARIVNSLFAHNTTNSDGAALFLYSTGGRIDLLHTTIADYTLNPKQAIFAQSGSVEITNTIIANHAIGIERWSGATVDEDYNLFYGNTKNLSGTIGSGNHHPVGSPKFVDPAYNNYHLGFGSAAIDAGVNAGAVTDLEGNARPVGNGFDIGAYENQYTGPIFYVYLPLIRR